MTRNIDRKQLKNPDQFVSFWSRVGTFVGARRPLVIGAAAAVVVLGLGIWGGASFLAKRAAQTSQAFGRVDRIGMAELLPADPEAAKKEPAPVDDGLPHFKTEAERMEAALKEARGFLAAHGGSNLADEAHLLEARYLLALGRPAEAAPVYEGLLRAHLDPRLRFLAHEGLGYAFEATGQTDKALGAFVALGEDADKADGFYKDRAQYHRARMLEKKGSGKDAEKVLREILEKSPTTPLREEINDRLAALEGK